MPILVHLAPEKYARHIKRVGLKGASGVYCMPVLQDYYVSHQWLRELKRRGQRTIVGIYFRVPSEQLVQVGHYGKTPQRISLGEAMRVIMSVADPQGYEIIVPRAITTKEIHSIQSISQTLGWRYSPGSHERSWCNCRACVSPGEINSSKKREARVVVRYRDMLTELCDIAERGKSGHGEGHEEEDEAIIRKLYEIGYKKAGRVSDLAFLLNYPNTEVLEALEEVLHMYAGKEARYMLQQLEERLHQLAAPELPGEVKELTVS